MVSLAHDRRVRSPEDLVQRVLLQVGAGDAPEAPVLTLGVGEVIHREELHRVLLVGNVLIPVPAILVCSSAVSVRGAEEQSRHTGKPHYPTHASPAMALPVAC